MLARVSAEPSAQGALLRPAGPARRLSSIRSRSARRLLFETAAVALLASACQPYLVRPLDPEASARDFDGRRLEGEAARAAVERWLPGHAEPWPPSRWDAAELVAVALDLNPRLAEARAALASAEADRAAARQRPAPTLGLLSEYSSQAGGASPWLLGVALDLPLDAGARRAGRRASADLAARQAVYDYAEVAWSVASSVRHALVDLELSGLEAERLRALVETRDEQLRLVRRRIELGAAAGPELGPRETDRVAERRRLDDAERRQTAARTRLAAALGLPAAALSDFHSAGEAAADPPLPAAADLDAWRHQTLLARADIRRAVAGYDLAEQALRLEVARQYPEIRLGPGYVWERGVVKLPFDLSLTLPWPGGNRAAIAAAEARRAQAGRHLEAAQAAALGEIESAEAERARSLSALASARGERLDVARARATRADAAFAAGALDRLEWLEARLGRQEAELAALEALRSAREATLALEDALRRPFAGAELELARPLESAAPDRKAP